MKLVFIIGSGAVGKMSVGQALMDITKLRLFHNHLMIEPMLEVFGDFNGRVVSELREVIFRNFAHSDQEGMIFTYMWAFDQQSDWDYVKKISDIFEEVNAEIYYVELIADQKIRLERNKGLQRMERKKSKRDIDFSTNMIVCEDRDYRLVSLAGELSFKHYLRIDNTDLSQEEAARYIKEEFNL